LNALIEATAGFDLDTILVRIIVVSSDVCFIYRKIYSHPFDESFKLDLAEYCFSINYIPNNIKMEIYKGLLIYLNLLLPYIKTMSD